MSLLINGMDMPKNGRVTIELASEETGTNILARITDDKTGKLIDHKGAVVIHTPHGRLIDADRLIAVLKSTTTIAQFDYDMFDHILGLIKHQPPIIEAEE